jgi:segregation and condensation protein B
MDDNGTLCFATDCASTDSEMRDTDERHFTDISMPAEIGTSLLAAEDPVAVEDELEADAVVMTRDFDDQMEASETDAVRSVVEALLFASDTALSAARLADLIEGCTPAQVRKHIEALNEKYEAIARGYQMMTLPDFESWIAKLNHQRRETRLSAAGLETLSIVAYKQPVIRADVEAIRGVACGEVISRLREMGLVRVLGRAEILGRPLLYWTTKRFLDTFGLADLDDLPPVEALRLKPVTKPANEVEPVKPAPTPVPVQQLAAMGA